MTADYATYRYLRCVVNVIVCLSKTTSLLYATVREYRKYQERSNCKTVISAKNTTGFNIFKVLQVYLTYLIKCFRRFHNALFRIYNELIIIEKLMFAL